MDPRPTNYLRQNIVFSYPEMIRVSFSLLFSLSVFCYFTLLLMFIKIILFLLLFYLFIYFHENYCYFFMLRDVPECSGMFRNVPCSGFYRRPFIKGTEPGQNPKKKKNADTHTRASTTRAPRAFRH